VVVYEPEDELGGLGRLADCMDDPGRAAGHVRPRRPVLLVPSAAGSDIEFEIGARKGIGKQGGVVLLLEYGAPRKALGARGFGVAALQENVDDLEQGIAKALDTAARRVNL
jgi:hypothetical protein